MPGRTNRLTRPYSRDRARPRTLSRGSIARSLPEAGLNAGTASACSSFSISLPSGWGWGRAVQTFESLADLVLGSGLSHVEQSLVEHRAVAAGFCDASCHHIQDLNLPVSCESLETTLWAEVLFSGDLCHVVTDVRAPPLSLSVDLLHPMT